MNIYDQLVLLHKNGVLRRGGRHGENDGLGRRRSVRTALFAL
jgi:hypothetical protein